MKIYELARELGLSTKETMGIVGELGLLVPTNHFQALDDEQANILRRHVLRSAVSDSFFDSKEAAPPHSTKPPQLIVRRRSGAQQRLLKSSEETARSFGGLDV